MTKHEDTATLSGVGSSDVLARCPFCGKEPRPVYYLGGYYHAVCGNCDIVMARAQLFSLIAAWNTRANKYS